MSTAVEKVQITPSYCRGAKSLLFLEAVFFRKEMNFANCSPADLRPYEHLYPLSGVVSAYPRTVQSAGR